MAIIAAPDGSYYSNKTGKTYTREEVLAKLAEKKEQDSGSLFGSVFSGNTTQYEQTGALENAIQGNGRGVDVGDVEKSYNAHSYVETDTDRAARLREASNILGLDEVEGASLMRGGLSDNDVMKSALALAKKKQNEPDDWEQFASEHPATVKYLEQQKNMAISYDDVKPLGRLEDTANQVKTHLEMMELEEKIADLGRKYDSANMSYNDLSADQRVELNDLLTRRKELAGNIDTWSIGNVLGGLMVLKEDLPWAIAMGLQTGLVGAGAGAVAGGVGAIPGALTGFGAGFRIGMGASMGYRMAGTQYAENMMRADANGQYMDANSLRQGAWGAGLGMTVLGSVGIGRLTNKLPVGQVYDKFLRTTSPSVLNNPAARETAWKGYLSTLGVGLKEAAIQDVIFGGGTSALTFGANRYSEALSGLDYSNREDGTLIDNIINGMMQFAPMALGTGVGFSVGGRMMSNALSSKGVTMPVADGLNRTMDAVNDTRTAQRSPQATRDAVNTIFGENASTQDVEIDARGLVRLCQEADPENPNLAAEVAQKLGVDTETLNKAVETEDTIRVSVTDFVTEMKDSELRQEVLKEVKDVDGVTENERGEILTYQQQVFEKNIEFIKAAANAEYDHNDPAWTAAYEATQNAYPKLKPKDLEQLTNVTYAGFKQMEERGVLQLNGFENAEQAIRAIEVQRKDAPSNEGKEENIASDVANDTVQELLQEKGKNDNVLAAMFPDSKYDEAGKIVPAEQGHAIIELYKNSNPSSLAHEMLHHWVFLHENAYRTGKMEGQVLQDFQKLAEFAGHELGTEWSEAEHEKLASAWETYLSEGKAPSLQLVSTFERFKNWMKRIYQALVRHSIPINDDVRGVFDRMLASDKELEMAQAFYESEPLFAGREMGAAELREYAALVNASHKEAQREMDKRVMAEVNPAMKEIRDNVEANLREDIAGQMMMEPVYAARALFTAPLESADFKAAKETAIKNKIEERLDLLVKQSALGVEKKGMIAEDAKQVSQEWFGGFSNNYDWYKEMFKRRGGKIPASWYRFIQAYKAGEKTLKQMPKTMRAEYEYIANEQLTHGHKESMLGDIPEDIEFVNLKENNPAMSWIVQNGGGIRLDRQSVYERFGKGALPERWLTDKNGYTIDEVADYVYDGQGSGDRLFQDLTTKPTFAKELNNRVRAGMAQFKDQEYGSLKDSAIKAVHNAKSLEAICLDLEIFEKNAAEFKSKQEQKTADAIADGREKQDIQNRIDRAAESAADKAAKKAAREQRWLDAAVMRGQVRAKMARAMAKEQLANTKVGEVLGWQKYAALAKKAGDEAVRLMSKGDYEGAIEAKNREITCHALAREAGKMDTEINKTLRYFNAIDKRGNKMKGIPHEFNVQIDKILSNYGLLSREPLKPLEGDKSLQTFMEELHNDYELPNVAEWVVEGQKKPFEELTINEMRDLKDSVESIRKIGRSIDKALTGDRKKTISIRKQECLDALAKLPQWRAADNEAGKRQTSIMQKLLEIPSTYIAPDMGKMETFFQILDKGEEQGAFIRNLYNPIMEGLAKWDEMQIRMSNGWKKVLTDTGWTDGDLRKARSEMYTFDFMKNPLSKMEMIMMGANIGNEGNRDRLRYYFMTEEQRALAKKGALTDADISEIDGKMWQVLEKLSEKDWKLIQGMWDFLGTFVPEIRQHEVELSGVDPKLVEAMPSSVMTADGKMVQLRGGYFPIRYDSDKSIRAATLDEANALFKSGMVYATTTDHNYTKGRAMRVNRPLLLELNTLFDHLQEVGYDLAMRKPILDVHRVLRDDRIQAGIASVYGQNLVKSANEWLRHLASSQRESLTVAEKFLKATRTRMSIACVGFRMQAIPIDMVQNMMTSAWKHGATTTFNAITRSIISGHYIQQWRFVTEKSPFMRNKLNMVDQNLADLRGSIFEEHKFRDYLQRAAFAPDLAADLMVQIPIWEEFYSRYIKEGMSEKEAITRADSKVRQIATDTSKAGLSRIQRKSELMKLITPFYSYFNGYLNRLWKDYELSRLNWYDGKKADAARLFTRMMLIGFIIPGVYEGFMRGYVLDNDQEKDPQKRAKNQKAKAISSAVGYWTGPSPFIGKGISLAVGVGAGNKNADFSLSPVESAFEKTFGAAGMAYKYWDKGRLDDKDKRRIGRSVLDASAIVGGYPNRWNDIIFNALDGMNRHDWTIKDVFFRRQNQK